jgi:3-oxo-4-pregnene-20-carboxyl-CoA dehydrogenase alpha subunit
VVDFALDDTQRTIADLARETLTREPAESAESVWKALSGAGLLALAVPERLGGSGLGLVETALVLTEVGRVAAAVPALHTLALGVLPIATFGSTKQQDELLSEERIFTAGWRGSVTVDSGQLSGFVAGVGFAATAYRILVGAGDRVVLVDPAETGVSLVPTPSSSGAPEFTVRFDRVPAEPLCDTRELRRFAVAGACAQGDGLLAGALELTADHVRTREQFGRPLATFQAVAQQIADVYIAARTVHLAALAACAEPEDVELAAYWLAEEALPAMHTCHHLHGGLGVDAGYPLHRYYSATKDLVRLLEAGHAR